MVTSNQTPIAPSVQPEVADVRSGEDSPNPVPKPPRGHFVDENEDESIASSEPSTPLVVDADDTGEVRPPKIERQLKPTNSVSFGGDNSVGNVPVALTVDADATSNVQGTLQIVYISRHRIKKVGKHNV